MHNPLTQTMLAIELAADFPHRLRFANLPYGRDDIVIEVPAEVWVDLGMMVRRQVEIMVRPIPYGDQPDDYFHFTHHLREPAPGEELRIYGVRFRPYDEPQGPTHIVIEVPA